MYLSPYVEEPLNSKVIKSFVPELRSRKCVSCSMYINTNIMKVLRTGMNMCVSRSHIMAMKHEHLPEAMNDWERWRDRVRDIREDGVTC